ncbi:hypothetical protein AX17_005117 [Amanita inopinata Kibby_2008]|nr:hypothetical protein AX17_005117 [Amanita inopinata Kibby_2008]
MVHLILSSPRGNQGLRYFPYSGYLGLTPVNIEGVIGTKLDSDLKPLQAKSISVSVRCYESRHGRVNIIQSNILAEYTQVLWSKPDNVDYDAISDLEFPFQITLPVDTAGFSTSVFVDYRCLWRVEAVLEHAPIYGVGSFQVKHFELPLIRYDVPSYEQNPPKPVLSLQTTKPKAPQIRYCVHSPASPVGPLDLVSVPIYLQPLESNVHIRSASLTIERRIQFDEITQSHACNSPPSSPMPHINASKIKTTFPPPQPQFAFLPSPSPVSHSTIVSHQDLNNAHISGTSSIASLASSNASSDKVTADGKRSFIAPGISSSSSRTLNSPKTVSNLIAGAESSGRFSKDCNGVWSKILTLQWPAAKSHSRWAIGETIRSNLVSVKFFVRVKVVVSSPAGVGCIELAEKELLVVSTNETERQLAISKFTQSAKLGTIRSKSKSPRWSRKEREGILPSPHPSSPSSHSENVHKSHSSGARTSTLKLRRPHTSAGPRDKTNNITGNSHTLSRNHPGAEAAEDPLGHALWKRRTDVDAHSETSDFAWEPDHNLEQSTLASAPSENSTIISGGYTDTESDDVREWEEELARIEMRSRRSSDLLGFSGKRKRSAGLSVTVPTEKQQG